jgi:four helix bundle protein
MKEYDIKEFNQAMRVRTRTFAIGVFKASGSLRLNELTRIPVKQLVRSASSVAANYYSATRGRSEAEYYSKICIVVEECDESAFWLDFLQESDIMSEVQLKELKNEADELLRIFATIKKKLKIKRSPVS